MEIQIYKDNPKVNSPKISDIRLYFPKRAESPPPNFENRPQNTVVPFPDLSREETTVEITQPSGFSCLIQAR